MRREESSGECVTGVALGGKTSRQRLKYSIGFRLFIGMSSSGVLGQLIDNACIYGKGEMHWA